MKTIRNIALALALAPVFMAGFAADAQAGVITHSGDTRNPVTRGFGGSVFEKGIVSITPQGQADANTVIDGEVVVNFDIRNGLWRVVPGARPSTHNAWLSISHGSTKVVFNSNDLDENGRLVIVNKFDGLLAGRNWLLRVNTINGPHKLANFGVYASYNTRNFGDAGNGGGGDGNGGGGNGGNGGGGGGQVPAPGPLGLIAAMALFGAWRRKRSTAG